MAGAGALVPVPIWIWYILRFSKKMQPAQMAQMKAGDEMVTVFTENVAGVHVVKAFATERTEIAKYDRAAETYFDRIMETVLLWRNFVPVVRGMAEGASNLALMTIGAVLVVKTLGLPGGRRGRCRWGICWSSARRWGRSSRLQQINQITEQYRRAITSSRRFFEVLDAPSTVPEVGCTALPAGPGAVDFHFVTFGYDADEACAARHCVRCAGREHRGAGRVRRGGEEHADAADGAVL